MGLELLNWKKIIILPPVCNILFISHSASRQTDRNFIDNKKSQLDLDVKQNIYFPYLEFIFSVY